MINQLLFVFNLCIFGILAGPGIYGAQFFGKGSSEGVRNTFRFKLYAGLLVLLAGGVIAGWTALRRVDPRWCYRGVAEVSIYIGEKFRGHGLGYHLLTELCRQAEAAGYWTLQSTVLQDNAASRALHTKCGFRLVGRRERIARDCHGRWLDTYLMEYRAAADEPVGYKKL